jgi:hypothetical protein
MTYAGKPRLDYDRIFPELSNDFNQLLNIGERDVCVLIGLLSYLDNNWAIVDSSGIELSKVGRLSDLDLAKAYLADLEWRLQQGETMQKIGSEVYSLVTGVASSKPSSTALDVIVPTGKKWRVTRMQADYVATYGGVPDYYRFDVWSAAGVQIQLSKLVTTALNSSLPVDLVLDAGGRIRFYGYHGAAGEVGNSWKFSVAGWEITE